MAVSLLLCSAALSAANLLQQAIDNAEAGSRLELPAGEYHGNIVIALFECRIAQRKRNFFDK